MSRLSSSRLSHAIRNRRELRAQRTIDRAISNAATPALRDELIVVAQRQDGFSPRG